MKYLSILLISFTTLSTFAAVETVCGKRYGSAGNVFLLNQKREFAVVLATQGADQKLANQADSFISGGMQNGTSYCVNTIVNSKGNIVRIAGAYPKKRRIRTYCGVRGGTAGNAWLESGDDLLTLAFQGNSQKGLKIVDRLVSGGTQNGRSYCVNGTANADGDLISAVGAFEVR